MAHEGLEAAVPEVLWEDHLGGFAEVTDHDLRAVVAPADDVGVVLGWGDGGTCIMSISLVMNSEDSFFSSAAEFIY